MIFLNLKSLSILDYGKSYANEMKLNLIAICFQGGGGAGYYGYKPPERESNFKRFLKGASEGLIMGSLGMLTGRR